MSGLGVPLGMSSSCSQFSRSDKFSCSLELNRTLYSPFPHFSKEKEKMFDHRESRVYTSPLHSHMFLFGSLGISPSRFFEHLTPLRGARERNLSDGRGPDGGYVFRCAGG